MKNSLFKIIWFAFPLTKLVYAYLAYTQNKGINNSFELINILLIAMGVLTSLISILLSRKIYQKSFYENKIVSALFGKTAFFGNTMFSKDSSSETIVFSLFSMLLGLAECAALFGFVQFLLTGNLIAGIILFALCFVAWLFNYPRITESQGGEE